MALSRLTDWNSGDILTDTALEAEFDNIYNNGLSLVSPLTADLAAGGNKLTGLGLGLVTSPSLQFTSDTNTGIYSSAADTVDIATGGVDAFQVGLSTSRTIAKITSTEAGALGPDLQLKHSGASPADNDSVAQILFIQPDDGAIPRVVAKIAPIFLDVTSTTMDSRINFSVMAGVNAGDAATVAFLDEVGGWNNACGAAGKEYIGGIDNVTEKIKSLKTLGTYRAVGLPVEKHATATVHYSPTAEEFHAIFGLGVDPSKTPGIAANDVAWLAVKLALELDERLAKLEKPV